MLSVVLPPGRVGITVEAAPVLVGSPDPADTARMAAADRWAGQLAAAGIAAAPTSTLLAELWAKVFYNAALNPLGALLGVPDGWAPHDPAARTIMDDAIGEAFAVARAAGVPLAWPDADAYRELFYERLVPAAARHASALLP